MTEIDGAALLLRLTLAAVMIAHGWNHLFGPGGVDGTARWFASMGLRPPRLHALASGWTELVAGAGLALGLFVPLQCAAVVGVMVVALITAHRTNGFFIFKPGQGWEYVAVLALAAVALATLGGGQVSLDEALGFADELQGGVGAGLAAGLGLAGALGLLGTCWRPNATAAPKA